VSQNHLIVSAAAFVNIQIAEAQGQIIYKLGQLKALEIPVAHVFGDQGFKIRQKRLLFAVGLTMNKAPETFLRQSESSARGVGNPHLCFPGDV